MCGIFGMHALQVFRQHWSLEYCVFPLAKHEGEETRPEFWPVSTGLMADLGQRESRCRLWPHLSLHRTYTLPLSDQPLLLQGFKIPFPGCHTVILWRQPSGPSQAEQVFFIYARCILLIYWGTENLPNIASISECSLAF